jgi:hypothetical protein
MLWLQRTIHFVHAFVARTLNWQTQPAVAREQCTRLHRSINGQLLNRSVSRECSNLSEDNNRGVFPTQTGHCAYNALNEHGDRAGHVQAHLAWGTTVLHGSGLTWPTTPDSGDSCKLMSFLWLAEIKTSKRYVAHPGGHICFAVIQYTKRSWARRYPLWSLVWNGFQNGGTKSLISIIVNQ